MNHQNKKEAEQFEALGNFCISHVDWTQTDRYLQQLAKTETSLERQVERLTNQVALLDVYTRQLGGDPSLVLAVVDAPTNPTREMLVQWMPAIFRNFWGVVTPREFAMLAGLSEVPRISSPFPEPTALSVEITKRQILNLPELERNELLGFFSQLPGTLELRPAMCELFGGRR